MYLLVSRSAVLLVSDRMLGFNAPRASFYTASVYSPLYNITQYVCVQFKYMSTAGFLWLSLYTLNSMSSWTQQNPMVMIPGTIESGYWYTAAFSIVDGLQQIDFSVTKTMEFSGVVDNVFVDDVNVTAGMCDENITTIEKPGQDSSTNEVCTNTYDLTPPLFRKWPNPNTCGVGVD